MNAALLHPRYVCYFIHNAALLFFFLTFSLFPLHLQPGCQLHTGNKIALQDIDHKIRPSVSHPCDWRPARISPFCLRCCDARSPGGGDARSVRPTGAGREAASSALRCGQMEPLRAQLITELRRVVVLCALIAMIHQQTNRRWPNALQTLTFHL